MTGPDVIWPLAGVGRADRPLAGGKGASLGELICAGFPVPDGFVVTTLAFTTMVQGLGAGLARRASGLDTRDHALIERTAAAIRAEIQNAPLPGNLRAAIAEHYRSLRPGPGAPLPAPAGPQLSTSQSSSERAGHPRIPGGPPVAVRSSATAEDGTERSFAGVADSYLWIRGEAGVAGCVRNCWASLYSAESLSYRRRAGLPEAGLAMAVVVQQMVDARCAGVMFTRSPASGDRSVIALEATWGLGSALVGGLVTPDSYLVSKVTGEIVGRRVAVKAQQHVMAPGGAGFTSQEVLPDQQSKPCLTDAEICALARLGRRVEEHYGAAQDIEWAIARDSPPGEGVFLLQSRPETVWAQRAAAPVATPKPTPFGHVLDLLSKRLPS